MGFIFSLSVVFLLFLATEFLRNSIAFKDAETVAYISKGSALLSLPFLLFIELCLLVPLIMGLESKKPIFGSKKYKYGEYPFGKGCLPVFCRCKNNRKKALPQKMLFCCFVLIVLGCLIPFSLFGREVLCVDNSIEIINSVNNVTKTYTADDYSSLSIKSKYVGGRYNNYWKYEITIEMKDGEVFTFSNRDFDSRLSDFNDICLDKMLEIKNCFSVEKITVKGDDIRKVSEYLNFNEQQYDKLKELFSIQK